MKLLLLLVLTGALPFSGAAFAVDLLSKGTYQVTETGFGRFRAKDESGNTVLLHLARGTSRFEPDQWLMHEGDKVYVEYMPTFRERAKPTCVLIRLVEKGPKSAALTSPLEGLVEEMGRGSVRVRVAAGAENVFSYTFAIGRRDTRYDPAGWSPRAGDRVRVQFVMRPAVIGWGYTLVANLIQQAENAAGAKADTERK